MRIDGGPRKPHLWLAKQKREKMEINLMPMIPSGKELAATLAAKLSVAEAIAPAFITLYTDDDVFRRRVTAHDSICVDGSVKDDQILATSDLRHHLRVIGRMDLADIPFPILKRAVGTLRRRGNISPKQLTQQSEAFRPGEGSEE